jgi:stage II sporulation protein D
MNVAIRFFFIIFWLWPGVAFAEELIRVGLTTGEEGKSYRGRLESVANSQGQLTTVNELSIDDYLQGVLGREIPQSWPLEVLKAQAVASRTYVLSNRGRHRKDGYDVCATVHCQVYGGWGVETEVINDAVQSTRGEVIVHRGRLVTTLFHSTCGGSTEGSEAVWGGKSVPHLKAVSCRWCRPSPRSRWDAHVPGDVLAEQLRRGGVNVGRILSLRVLSHSPSGRASRVRVRGTKGHVDMQSNRFRLLVGGDVLRSTFWTHFYQKKEDWFFRGKGWGHGVGLCQWGMKGLADQGRSYKDIVHFYYRNVDIN